MATPSINIGLCNNGKAIVKSIDNFFYLHESEYYKYILSCSLSFQNNIIIKESIEGKDFIESKTKDIQTWFEYDVYSKINNLIKIKNPNWDGEAIIVNIITPIAEENSTIVLNDLLEAINELVKKGLIANVNVKIFSIIYPITNNEKDFEELVKTQLIKLNELANNFESLIQDVYYFDDRNTGATHLNLNLEWLGFALGEYFILQMIGPTSQAILNKNKIFGLGIVHFNEVLFREVIVNKILQYKFKEEGINSSNDIQIKDVIDKCNPFIKEHQNFFDKFIEKHPYSKENENNLTENSTTYIDDFKINLENFINSGSKKLGEAKAILANLIGENDKLLKGIDWKGERLFLKDLEFDIIDYFNEFVNDDDKVNFKKQKNLQGKITSLENGIKSDKKKLKEITKNSEEIHSELDISFEEGVFSVDGKRLNASGYIPSPISPNDEIYTISDNVIPSQLDLSNYFTSVKNQGELGSCTAFPVASIYEFYAKQNNKQVSISELFIYYNSRELRGNVNEDTGATLLDAVNSVKEKGACYTESFPYDISNFKSTPSENAFIEAQHQVVEKAFRINRDEKDFKHAVASGHPVIIGLKLFKSFYPNKTGIVKYPSNNEKSLDQHGNHAMLIVGYNDKEKLFKVRNSWGTSFGDNGYCYIPYDYVTNTDLCIEAFVITKIVDLSFEEFNYDSTTSFSFIKDNLIRRKIILEYNLRNKNNKIVKLRDIYDDLAFKNDSNIEQIKEPMFRKNILENLQSKKVEKPIIVQPTNPQIKISNTLSISLMVGGVLLMILSVLLLPIVTIIGTSIGVIIGIILLIIGFKKYKSNPKSIPEAVINIDNNKDPHKEKLYRFMVADRLFEAFDKLDNNIIKRYKSISMYFDKIKKWKEESQENIDNVNFNSPTFVFNIIEERKLLSYISNNKVMFLEKLQDLSEAFYNQYQQDDSISALDIFSKIKKAYLQNLKYNIDSIIDVSMVDYLTKNKEYPFFNKPPELKELIPTLNKVSSPFCNIKASEDVLIIQHYTIKENIEENKTSKENDIYSNFNASIKPSKVYRTKNSKKLVLIQVAALDNIDDLVRF